MLASRVNHCERLSARDSFAALRAQFDPGARVHRLIGACAAGDIDDDGDVDLQDLAILLANFGTPSGANWADGASNLGAGQDPQARRFLDKNNAGTARDLRGGWADAGDFNKYTSWEAGYAQELMDVYVQNPTVFTDDFNIPESYNNIPDILDEAKYGLDYLKRLQNADGSVLSIVGVGGASPPSADTSPSYYGDASTSATLAAAAAFAEGAKVLGSLNNSSLSSYVQDLQQRATCCSAIVGFWARVGGISWNGKASPFWYASVYRSTGFEKYVPREEPLPARFAPMRDAAARLYDVLASHRL